MICSHFEGLKPVRRRTKGCEECEKAGTKWVHLRECLVCGHVGCCNSSPGKHATKHFEETGHPVMRSAEEGENWGYCYVDRLTVRDLGDIGDGRQSA